jgi:hypothetical protein
MAATLPVPIECELPDGWNPAAPDDVGAPGVAFIALHPLPQRTGFTPNITISGEVRHDRVTLDDIAEESIRRLGETSERATLARRTSVGTAEAPGLAQLVNIRHLMDGVERDLIQCQVYLSMHDVEDTRRRAVVQVAVTAPTEQFADVLADFRQFVASVRPDPADQHPGAGRVASNSRES